MTSKTRNEKKKKGQAFVLWHFLSEAAVSLGGQNFFLNEMLCKL